MLTLPRKVTVDSHTGSVIYSNVYTQLLEYIVPADLLLFDLMVGAVIVMRHKAPGVERPLAPSTSGIGHLLVLTGVPFYLAWRRAVAPR